MSIDGTAWRTRDAEVAEVPGGVIQVQTLDSVELLERTDDHEASFGQCKLLSDTDAWSTVEGDVMKHPWPALLPSLGDEFVRVWSPEIPPAV